MTFTWQRGHSLWARSHFSIHLQWNLQWNKQNKKLLIRMGFARKFPHTYWWKQGSIVISSPCLRKHANELKGRMTCVIGYLLILVKAYSLLLWERKLKQGKHKDTWDEHVGCFQVELGLKARGNRDVVAITCKCTWDHQHLSSRPSLEEGGWGWRKENGEHNSQRLKKTRLSTNGKQVNEWKTRNNGSVSHLGRENCYVPNWF